MMKESTVTELRTDRWAPKSDIDAMNTAGGSLGRPHAAGKSLALLRILLGSVFLWTFLDKTFGLGYSTTTANSWLAGHTPTGGYLSSLKGPLAATFHPLVGQPWVDWTFMLGMLLVGTALILGIALRAAAVGGSLIMALMWLSSLPLQNNPIVDEHVIYACSLWVLALAGAGHAWGVGRIWSTRSLAKRLSWLR